MLVWLNGNQNVKRQAERELRPRDDGAVHARREPRRLHRDRRARAGARADRLAGQRRRTAGSIGLHASTPRATTPARRRSSARAAHYDWQDSCQLCLDHPTAPVVLRREAVELLRPDAARRGDLDARSQQLYEHGAHGAAGRRGDPAAPATSTTGRAWSKPPVVSTPGLLRMARPRTSTPRPGGRSASRRASSSSTRRTSAAGTTRAGSTPRPSARRWFIAALVQGDGRRRPTAPSDPAKLVAARARSSGAARRSRRRRRALLEAFAQGAAQAQDVDPATSRPRCAGSSPPPPTSRPLT